MENLMNEMFKNVVIVTCPTFEDIWPHVCESSDATPVGVQGLVVVTSLSVVKRRR